jgi:hypothetical protein
MAAETQQQRRVGNVPRTIFGVVLFLAWGVESILWVASTVDQVADGKITPLITAVAALALMALLAGMEGLEVAVIDRWRSLYPDRTTSELAGWLAARQLFVALIVTTATLLANRGAITIPFSSTKITGGLALGLFDLTWTGFTVLWFAQIFPKHLAATNPDRYLSHTQRSLFPVVEWVRRIGVSQPGEWVAGAVERRLNWPAAEPDSIEEGPLPREESLAAIWRELIPADAQADVARPAAPRGEP